MNQTKASFLTVPGGFHAASLDADGGRVALTAALYDTERQATDAAQKKIREEQRGKDKARSERLFLYIVFLLAIHGPIAYYCLTHWPDAPWAHSEHPTISTTLE